MSDATPVTRFDIASGELRGTELLLGATSLVHRGADYQETLPLALIAAVRVEFDRDTRRLGWAVACIVGALIVFAAAGPLGALAHTGAQEIAGQHPGGAAGVAGALLAFFRLLEGLAAILPLLGAAACVGAAVLGAFGWIGGTTLTVSFAGGERAYAVRGRNALLVEFAERVAESLAALKR